MGLPGVQVRLELQKSDPGFVIMMPVEAAGQAAHNYAVQITNSQLYVPVGTLTTPMYKTIESKLERNKMHIPYRSTEIVHHIFGKDRNYFSTNRLFSGEGNPCRIVVGFVELPAYSGDQFLNTFNFKRRFKTDGKKLRTSYAHIYSYLSFLLQLQMSFGTMSFHQFLILQLPSHCMTIMTTTFPSHPVLAGLSNP